MIKKLFKLVRLILSFDYYVYYLFLKYRIVFSYEHLSILKYIKEIDIVLDIGANKGQFSLLINHHFPKKKIILFEPLNFEYQILKKIFRKRKNILIKNYLVGNSNVMTSFNISKKSDSSSILKPGKIQLDYYPSSKTISRQKVKMIKLRSIRKFLNYPTFVKIDVQGYEQEVLKGMEYKNIKYIYLEGSDLNLYEEQPIIKKIILFLKKKNFKKIAQFNVNRDKNGKVIYGDFLFRTN